MIQRTIRLSKKNVRTITLTNLDIFEVEVIGTIKMSN